MRVCLVTSCFPPSRGGIERCVFELSSWLKGRGHDVTIVTTSRGLPVGIYDYRSNRVGHVIRYPERFILLEVPVVPQIPVRLLLDNGYDVLHIHGMTPSQTDLSLVASKLSKAKVIYTHHFDPETYGGHLTKLYSYWGRSIVGLADEITSSTRSYAETSRFLKPVLDRLRIVPMGVNSRQFDAEMPDETEIGLDPRLISFGSKILYVGKLIYYKGLDHLLHAFSRLKTTDVCLIIVGEGIEREALRQLSKELQISDRVIFLGTVSESLLPSIYSLADVIVLPSVTRREAFGMVLLEAMASGKPVVASAIPGVRDVVRHGVTGFLVPPRDPVALASVIDDVLQDRSRAEKMGEEARRMTRTHYDWEQVCSLYFELYEGRFESSKP